MLSCLSTDTYSLDAYCTPIENDAPALVQWSVCSMPSEALYGELSIYALEKRVADARRLKASRITAR